MASVEGEGGGLKTATPSAKNTGGPIRLSSVQGYETRTNDVIYCPPLEKAYIREGKELQNTAIVYFGGDIQVSRRIFLFQFEEKLRAEINHLIGHFRTSPRTCRCITIVRRT